MRCGLVVSNAWLKQRHTHGLEMNFREMEERYIETICAGKSLNRQHKLLQSATDYIDGLHTFIRN